MKVCIPVKDRAEKRAIELAMADPATRALVVTMGILIPLPSDRSRARVLSHVADMLDEDEEKRRLALARTDDAVAGTLT